MVLIDSLGGGPMMSGELALMPRSNALAGVNPALGVRRRFPPAHSFPPINARGIATIVDSKCDLRM